VDRGKLYLREQQQLRQVASTRGSADLFQYGIVDSISDFASSNHEVSVRAGGGMKAGIGGAGIVGSIGLGAGAAVPSGGSSGVVAAAGATASFYYGKSGLEQAFGSYQHKEGSMVLRSTDVPTNSFLYDVHTNIGLDAAVTVGGGAVLQGLGGSVLRGIEASRALLSEGKMVVKEGVKNTVSVVSGRVDRLLQRPVVAPVTRPTPTSVVARVADPATGGTGVTGPPSLNIIRNSSSRVIGVEGTQKHHIVHQSLKDHPLWEKAGMDIEGSFNQMLLPTKKGALSSTTKRSIHEGRHLKAIKDSLEDAMHKALKRGKELGYSQEQYQKALKKIIKDEHSALKSGDRMLNKNARSWSEPIRGVDDN